MFQEQFLNLVKGEVDEIGDIKPIIMERKLFEKNDFYIIKYPNQIIDMNTIEEVIRIKKNNLYFIITKKLNG